MALKVVRLVSRGWVDKVFRVELVVSIELDKTVQKDICRELDYMGE